MLRAKDRMDVLIGGIFISMSAIMMFNAIKMMDSKYFSLIVFICYGGLTPCVMNLRVRMWMAFQC